MGLLLVGLNHRTAPVALRERLVLEHDRLAAFLLRMQAAAPEGEFVVLSTCNRLEVYGAQATHADIERHLQEDFALSIDELRPHLYTLCDDDAVNHLMRVACGLESMILGEPQILGQVADALEKAQALAAAGAVLNRLFTDAVHAGKRARTETSISQHRTSISHIAAVLALRHLQPESHILIVGAGEMAATFAQALIQHEVANPLGIINRTYEKTAALAHHFGAIPYEWYHLWQQVAASDVVITATGAPHSIFEATDIRLLMVEREHRPLTLIDISVPRNVAPDVREVAGVTCYDIDDLQQVVDEHRAQREACIPAVEAIVDDEHRRFSEWLASRGVVPVIKDLRQTVQSLVEIELADVLNKLDHLPDGDKAVVQRFAHRVVNKLLHTPTNSLRSHAASADAQAYVQVVRELFALE